MIHWGINALNHGASLAIFENGDLRNWVVEKNKDHIDLDFLMDLPRPNKIFWYERPWLKKIRQVRAGQYLEALDFSVLPKRYLKGLTFDKLLYTPHHASHASAGYYTSGFDRSAVVVVDAIGEFESATIWLGQGKDLKKLWSVSYPNSLGLFYSAFTKLIGYKPIGQEYQLQELAKQGDKDRYYEKIKKCFKSPMSMKRNFHKGVWWWLDPVDEKDRCHIASAVQAVFEEQIDYIMELAQTLTGSNNLVYMGGCAMNSEYNRRLPQRWKKIWSLPDPGDSSSSIGAVLWHSQKHQDWTGAMAKHITIIR